MWNSIKQRKMKIVFGLCFLILAVQHGSALQCYDCLTGCDDPFSSNGVSITDCSGSCMKTEKDDKAVRNCLPAIKKTGCEEVADADVCFCTTDLCNGASGRYVTRGNIIVAIACVILGVLKFSV